jgi:hypothetical protein
MQAAEGNLPSGSRPLVTPSRRRSHQLDTPDAAPAVSTSGAGADWPTQVAARETTLGFVQQHDCLMPTLTVTETILFGMMFREHVKSRDTEDAAATVAALLSELGLQSALCCTSATGRSHVWLRICASSRLDCSSAVVMHRSCLTYAHLLQAARTGSSAAAPASPASPAASGAA